MQPNTVNNPYDTTPPVPPELLEAVARALAAALIPPPRRPPPPETEEGADFLTAAQLARRLGVSRETVRRLAIAGVLPHTVVCYRARTVTARPPRHRSLAAPARFAARWRELAACRSTDLGVFFPERGESAGPARQVCAACPVRQPCLDYAITNRIVHGIWGGLTERERRALQCRWVRAMRRDRDLAISAAVAAGSTAAAIGRSFGLSRTSVTRIV